MNIIVCIDDNCGLLFNKRRQSRDSKVMEDIWKMADKLWIHSFSEKLLENDKDNVKVDDMFLEKAEEGEFCFVENKHLSQYEGKIEKLIVYKWNRKYPADFRLDLDLSKWQMESQEEFAGSSHDKITKEIYIK